MKGLFNDFIAMGKIIIGMLLQILSILFAFVLGIIAIMIGVGLLAILISSPFMIIAVFWNIVQVLF